MASAKCVRWIPADVYLTTFVNPRFDPSLTISNMGDKGTMIVEDRRVMHDHFNFDLSINKNTWDKELNRAIAGLKRFD